MPPAIPCWRDHLSGIEPSLGPALFPPASRKSLHDLAARLPALSMGGIECRLGADCSRVDLQLHLPRLSDQNLVRASFEMAPILSQQFERWLQSDAGVQLPSVWLEYDVDSTVPSAQPSMFFELRLTRDDPTGRSAIEYLARSLGLDQLAAWPAARDCLRGLPSRARVSHLGVMPSREGHPVCIRVVHLDPIETLELLDRHGGPRLPLVDFVNKIVEARAVLLGIGDAHTRAGLEIYAGGQPRDNRDHWRLLLGILQEHGLCTAEKRRELMAWPGGQNQPIGPPYDVLGGLGLTGVLVRRINHLKIGCSPDGVTEAKAYLSCRQAWIPRMRRSSQP